MPSASAAAPSPSSWPATATSRSCSSPTPRPGLRAVIAIHSTALGPSLGGVRFRHYGPTATRSPTRSGSRRRCRSRPRWPGSTRAGARRSCSGTTPTAAAAALLEALGRAIDELGGRYLAAEDVGATTADMDGLARVTPWVTGVDERAGGSGDPSPVTAFGVVCAMRAALQELDGDAVARRSHACTSSASGMSARRSSTCSSPRARACR